MKIHEAADFFRDLLIKTDGKSERGIYQTFLGILTDLNMRGLNSSQLYEIENKLDELQLSAATDNRKKYLKKKLATFETYLEKDFSLVKEEHYQNTGIGLGMVFGMLAGMIFGPSFDISNGMIVGMLIGMVIGLLIGQHKDKEAKEENRVMSIKVK